MKRIGRLAGWIFALGLALSGGLAPRVAHAAPGDAVTAWNIDYVVGTDGRVQVTERLSYHFGTPGRHGWDRYFVTREKYDDQSDAVYRIDNLRISSPTGAPSQYAVSSSVSGSDAKQRVRIGDPNQTVDSDETYVLNYSIAGAMRSFHGYDEFYWDATGFDSEVPISQLRVTATVPGGAQEVRCFHGVVRATTPCQTANVQGEQAVFAQPQLPVGEGMSIGVKIKPGLVNDPHPILEPSATRAEQQRAYAAAGATGLTALLAPVIGVWYWLRRGRDERYLGLPPGTVPSEGERGTAKVGPSPKLNIPVAFSPPRIPVAEGGVLIDGQYHTRETAATLIDLAVRGGLTLAPADADGRGRSRNYLATLNDPSVARARHEQILLSELFQGGPGTTVMLGEQGSMARAHERAASAVHEQVVRHGWFHRLPGVQQVGPRTGALWVLVAMGWVGLSVLGASAWFLLPLLPIAITLWVWHVRSRRGRRTATGRAYTDQVEGFRTYLATAEADQLRFEEGEDIFSKYLPWAIMFDLTERWEKLCQQLVDAGRIPQLQPSWYYGDFYGFNMFYLTGSLSTSALPTPPPPSAGSAGSGWGGGSSFGGGGFSGGGGGGGGVGGSW